MRSIHGLVLLLFLSLPATQLCMEGMDVDDDVICPNRQQSINWEAQSKGKEITDIDRRINLADIIKNIRQIKFHVQKIPIKDVTEKEKVILKLTTVITVAEHWKEALHNIPNARPRNQLFLRTQIDEFCGKKFAVAESDLKRLVANIEAKAIDSKELDFAIVLKNMNSLCL